MGFGIPRLNLPPFGPKVLPGGTGKALDRQGCRVQGGTHRSFGQFGEIIEGTFRLDPFCAGLPPVSWITKPTPKHDGKNALFPQNLPFEKKFLR